LTELGYVQIVGQVEKAKLCDGWTSRDLRCL